MADKTADKPTTDIPEGYRDIPEEDRKKAKAFFDRGGAVAATGQYDYSIEMFLQGFSLDPDAVDAHGGLRDIAMKRKASGGKSLGMFDKMKIKTTTKDDKANMLAAEKLLAYDPGERSYMLALMQNAHRAGYWDTAMWIGPILQKANAEHPKPDFSIFMALKDIYKALGQWKLATDACQYAAMMRQDDMDLQTELKNLGAQHTMSEGKYGTAKTFRDSIKDMDGQKKLLDADKDVRDNDIISRQIVDAEAEWKAQPEEPGKITKYVDALVRSEQRENEERAKDVLGSAFERSRQFRFRMLQGQIKIKQMIRQERLMRERVKRDPTNEQLKQDYLQFRKDQVEEELKEYTLFAENYPTDLNLRFEMAKRMFVLERFSEAIPLFQTARQDPKLKVDAGNFLGMAFLEAGFVDEAADTFRALIEEYQLKGDQRSKDMYYWYARSLEAQNELQSALKAYSQVAQWDFNYRDVQGRIKKLRGGGGPPAPQQ